MRPRQLLFIYAAPATVLVALFFLLPLAAMAWLSLFQQRGFDVGSTMTLANYAAFFSRGYYLQALWNSVWLAAVVTAVSVVIAYPFAYCIAFHLSPRWQRIAIVACILPFWTSYLVRSYSWLLALSGNGIVAQAAGWMGIPGASIANTNAASIVGFVHFFVMLLTLTIFANLARIPRSYLRAGADLGARPLQQFLFITLPLSLPGLLAGALLTFALSIGDYVTPQILGGNKQLVLTQVIMLQIQREGNFAMSAAISLVLMVITIAVTLVANRAIARATP